MSLYTKKLKNGLSVYIEHIPSSKTVTVKYIIAAGSLDETGSYKGQNNFGVAHFTEHMLYKGTRKRTADQINLDIANIGGITNAYTMYDRTGFYISSPAIHWKKNIEILTDLVWNATIPDDEFDKEKTVIIEELKMYADDPYSCCLDQLDNLINDDDNRKSIAGSISSVKKLIPDDIKRFRKCFYIPNNASIIIAGNIPVNECFRYIESLVVNIMPGLITNRSRRFTDANMNYRLAVSEKSNISQAHLAFAIKGVVPYDKNFYIQLLLADLLGNGFSSRLCNKIREKYGLAYIMSVYCTEMRDSSYIIGYCGLDSTNINKAHCLIAEELNKLKYELVEETELNTFKALCEGGLLLTSESTASKTNLYVDNFIYHTNESMQGILQAIKSVTPQDIQRFARKYINKNNMCFSIVKPKSI